MAAEAIDKTNNGTIDEWHYHHEDQLGTLRGMTDVNGNRIAEIDTGKYGQVFQKDILFDGRPSRVGEAYSPEEGLTRIDLAGGHTYPETVEGAVLRAADANGAYTAIVTAVDTNGTWIELDDASGDVLDAVGAGADFVIFDNRIGSVSGGAHTGGTWEDSVYISGPDTSLIDAGESFDSYIVGWHVQVDASVPVYFEILDANGDEITVSGDVTGLITEGETEFCIIHPVGVDPETGATQEDPCVPESRYIWGGGLYLPPVAGFDTGGEIQGSQTGSNMSGQHYMWNRVYDINTGRWTTPDPAATPWWNLQDYVAANPLGGSDPSGLMTDEEWERRSGVGKGIRTGTMKQVAKFHGETYTASCPDCGNKNCEINFKFNKFYKGDYPYPAAGDKLVRGVYISLSVSLKNCCECKEVRLLQVVRSFKLRGKPGDSTRPFVTATPASETRRARSGWNDKAAPSRGWRVDTNSSARPYASSSPSHGSPGSSTKPAIKRDAPGNWHTARNDGLEFYTCAVCHNDNQKGKVLACLRWSYFINDDGDVTFQRTPTPETSCGYPTVLKDSVERWNKMEGNTDANIDFTK